MNFYKCYIAVDGWSTVYVDHVGYLWAPNETEAKLQYCKQQGFRKNKKGLTVEQIDYRRIARKARVVNELVTRSVYKYWLGHYDEQVYEDVTHYYCSNCGNEVHQDRYCKCCNSELYNVEE